MSRVGTRITSYSIDRAYQNLQNTHNDTAETQHFYVKFLDHLLAYKMLEISTVL